MFLWGASLVFGTIFFFALSSEGKELPETPLLEEKFSGRLWTIGIPTNYPPLFFTDPHRSPEGAAIEIYEAIFALLKEPVMFVLVDDWEDALAVLTEAGVDAISNLGVLERNAQSKGLLLSDPIEEFDVRLFFRRGEKPFSSRKDLVQRVLGVVRHTSVEEYLRQARAQTIVTYRTIPDLVFALLSGEIEAAVCEEGLFEGVARQAGIDDRIFSYGFSLMKSRFRFVLPPGGGKARSPQSGNPEFPFEPGIRQAETKLVYRKGILGWRSHSFFSSDPSRRSFSSPFLLEIPGKEENERGPGTKQKASGCPV